MLPNALSSPVHQLPSQPFSTSWPVCTPAAPAGPPRCFLSSPSPPSPTSWSTSPQHQLLSFFPFHHFTPPTCAMRKSEYRPIFSSGTAASSGPEMPAVCTRVPRVMGHVLGGHVSASQPCRQAGWACDGRLDLPGKQGRKSQNLCLFKA